MATAAKNTSWAEQASDAVTRVDSWQALKHIAIKLYSDLIDAHVGRLAGTDSDYSKAASTSATHTPISFPLMAHDLDSQTRFVVHEDQVCLTIPSSMIGTRNHLIDLTIRVCRLDVR